MYTDLNLDTQIWNSDLDLDHMLQATTPKSLHKTVEVLTLLQINK